MDDRPHYLRSALERQYETLSRLTSERPDLGPSLAPVLEDVRSALLHLHVLARPEALHPAADVVGSA